MSDIDSTLVDILSQIREINAELEVVQSDDVIKFDPTWTAPTFENSWVDYDGTHTAGYFKTGGIVHLIGWVKDGTINTTAFTLPTGYRPSQVLRFPVYSYNATDSGGDTINFGVVGIETSGAVVPRNGNTGMMALDNIAFYADGS